MTALQLTTEGAAFIASFEGFAAQPYTCPAVKRRLAEKTLFLTGYYGSH